MSEKNVFLLLTAPCLKLISPLRRSGIFSSIIRQWQKSATFFLFYLLAFANRFPGNHSCTCLDMKLFIFLGFLTVVMVTSNQPDGHDDVIRLLKLFGIDEHQGHLDKGPFQVSRNRPLSAQWRLQYFTELNLFLGSVSSCLRLSKILSLATTI